MFNENEFYTGSQESYRKTERGRGRGREKESRTRAGREVYYEELVDPVMEAEKSQNLQSASWRLSEPSFEGRTLSVDSILLSFSVLLRPSGDWIKSIHIGKVNLQ